MSDPEARTRWHEAVERLNLSTSDAARADFDRGESAGPRRFLWVPLVACVRALTAAGPEPRLERAVVAGYAEMARAAKLWEAHLTWREENLQSFRRLGRSGVVRREWRDILDGILAVRDPGSPLQGGRGGTRLVATERGWVVLKRYRRGGAMRFLGSTYFGLRARPLLEFFVLIAARRRGLGVPDPIAAVIERRLGFFYRGTLVTAEISGGISLWDFLQGPSAESVAPALARGLRRLHDSGLHHRDLNLRNILVVPGSGEPELAFVDLDRASLSAGPISAGARRRALRRFRRSARKLDPAGRVVTDGFLRDVDETYFDARRS